MDTRIQSTLTLRTPHYCGHPANTDSGQIPIKIFYRCLTETISRYYGLSLLRTLNRGVCNKESWLYYGQFRFSRRKAHIFSLKLTRLIRTTVNTDNGHFSVSQVTNSHTLSTPPYGHFLSVYCVFSTFLRACLSNIQFTPSWLKASVQRKESHIFFKWFRFHVSWAIKY